MSRYRVTFAYLLGFVVLWLARPTPSSLLMGLVIALLGEAIRLWASGHIEKTERLATGGPYAHTRNPLYLGSIWIAVGVAVATTSPWGAILVAVYVLLFYPSVMREEAQFLKMKFGEEYATWAAGVPFFLPRLTPAGPRASRFEWRRVRENREWRTLMGLILAFVLLWAFGLLPEPERRVGLAADSAGSIPSSPNPSGVSIT